MTTPMGISDTYAKHVSYNDDCIGICVRHNDDYNDDCIGHRCDDDG